MLCCVYFFVRLAGCHAARSRWLLVGALGPGTELQDTRHGEERHEAVAAGSGDGRGQASGHGVEARELHVVLHHGTQRCHHRNTSDSVLTGP